MSGRLSTAQKQLAFRLRAHGWSLGEIGRQIGCSASMIGLIARKGHCRTGLADEWTPRASCLSIVEREHILLGVNRGESQRSIARRLGRAASTISRELAANGGRADYGAWRAHQRARACARRPKPYKLRCGPLLEAVSEGLLALWSPQEIAQRLRLDHPRQPAMHVSHETIYQSLFVQGRGELRRELARCLRSGRTIRRAHGQVERRGKLPNMVMLSERPAEVADRAVPGHWEGDTILGKGGRSAVGTLVERTTRFVLLLHLGGSRSADTLETAMRTAIQALPDHLRRTITWDQGAEMANHVHFTVATGIPIYFCDPHAPWQRGSNENTNGLLRQYMPKGTDLSKHTPADLRSIQDSLNGRPRMTLGYRTPGEKMLELLR
jgi:IS30 family transposase